jgi:hypothetical protein
MLTRWLKEPLVHFMAIGFVIFAAYALLNRNAPVAQASIVVSPAKIEQLVTLFGRTWQRPPTPGELKGVIDDYVKEEIYVREALALGLDKDDDGIRRRLRTKIEFLYDAESEALQPSDEALNAYLKANAARYTTEPVIAFQQIVLRPDVRGERIDADAADMLATLRGPGAPDASTLGDSIMLPFSMPPSSKTAIGQMFGPEFADAIEADPQGAWTGPVVSPYGLHLVRITYIERGRTKALKDVRAAVSRDWMNDQRKMVSDARLADLLKRYKVVIEAPAAPGTSAP